MVGTGGFEPRASNVGTVSAIPKIVELVAPEAPRRWRHWQASGGRFARARRQLIRIEHARTGQRIGLTTPPGCPVLQSLLDRAHFPPDFAQSGTITD